MSTQATGTFTVKLTPQSSDPQPVETSEGVTLAHLKLDKQFHGDLEATSVGQMLTAVTSTKGSAGYVAIERITGTLHGRFGSFVFQHNSTMNRGTPEQDIVVVPDSGSGDLATISGRMTIRIEGGNHSYVFEYSLPE